MKNESLKIGIIGAGNMGAQLGKLWSKAGYQVRFSSRNSQKLGYLLKGLKDASIGTVDETIEFADIIVLAVNYATIDEIITKLEGRNEVIIDLTNPFVWTPERTLSRVLPDGWSAGEELQRRLPKSRVIKAFSSHYAESLKEGYRDYPIAVLFTTNGKLAMQLTETIISNIGFAPLYYGGLNKSLDIELYGKYSNKIMSLDEAEAEVYSPASYV
ncbi:MAG: NAD(P)-binding domain-containing protein [Bacteroidota bacterium]